MAPCDAALVYTNNSCCIHQSAKVSKIMHKTWKVKCIHRIPFSVFQCSGVMLIAKVCINIVFLGCFTHFGHIAATPYAKWLNTDWTSNGSLWLPHQSTLDLHANSVSSNTATQLTIFGVISSVALHSSPQHTATVQVQSKFRWKGKENWEVKVITGIKRGPCHCRRLCLNSAITVRRLAWVKRSVFAD